MQLVQPHLPYLKLKCELTKSQFEVPLPCKLTLTIKISHQEEDSNCIVVKYVVDSAKKSKWVEVDSKCKYHKNISFYFEVTDVLIERY